MNRPLHRVLDALQARGLPVAGKGGRWIARCPAHDDRKASLSIRQAEDGKVLIKCHAGCKTEDVLKGLGLQKPDLFPRKAASRDGRAGRRSSTVRYEIRNLEGDLVAIHERIDRPGGGKSFCWYGPDRRLGLDGRPVASLPLYGIHRWRGLRDGAEIVVVEGEKAAEALWKRGIAAVGTVTGAAVTPSVDSLRPLARFRVRLWPDNDAPGRQHMDRIAARLHGAGCRDISVICWTGAPEGGDAADFNGSDDNLTALIASATPWRPPPGEDGETLLKDIKEIFRRFVVFPQDIREPALEVLALWVLHTWLIDCFDVTCYLLIDSPEKRCGKTRLLEVIELLVHNPRRAANITAAALFRMMDAHQPTLLLDEVDALFRGNHDRWEDLRSILNSGYRRGGVATRCVKRGSDYVPCDFGTFGPKVLCGINSRNLPDTIRDRSLVIRLERRTPDEPCERFMASRIRPQADNLKKRIESWAGAHAAQLSNGPDPPPLENTSDRLAEVSDPLLRIAGAVSPECFERAKNAILALAGRDSPDGDSLGVRLLADIRRIFEGSDCEALSSTDLVQKLRADETAPWAGLPTRGGGTAPLDERGLARLLRPYGIRPHNIRLQDGSQRKGYSRHDFEEAWRRYLPSGTHEDPSRQAGTQPPAQGSEDGSHPSQDGIRTNIRPTQVLENQELTDSGTDGTDISGDKGAMPQGGTPARPEYPPGTLVEWATPLGQRRGRVAKTLPNGDYLVEPEGGGALVRAPAGAPRAKDKE